MNRNLRLKIEASIEDRIVSDYLCFLCLACLEEKINFSNRSTAGFEKQRLEIAKVLLSHGVEKDMVREKMCTISKQDYPTLKQITAVYDMIQRENYTYVADYILEKGHIHYKSEEELEADRYRKPIKRDLKQEEEAFASVIAYIETEILGRKMDTQSKEKVKQLRTAKYPYEMILQTCKWESKTIRKALEKKYNTTVFERVSYICGVLKNKLPDTFKRLQQKEMQEKQDWLDNAKVILQGDETLESMIYLHCDKHETAVFYGKHEYVRQKLLEALAELQK